MTNRTSGLSMPIPNATVATMTYECQKKSLRLSIKSFLQIIRVEDGISPRKRKTGTNQGNAFCLTNIKDKLGSSVNQISEKIFVFVTSC